MAIDEQPNEERTAFEPPPWLRRLTAWWKGGEILGSVSVAIAALLVGRENGLYVGAGAFVLLAISYVSSRAVRHLVAARVEAVEKTMQARILSKGDKAFVKNSLRNTTYIACVAIGLVGILSLTIIALRSWDAIYRAIYTDVPKGLSVANAEYFSPERDKQWLIRNPFLQGLINYLQMEGESEGKDVAVFWANIDPFTHPTPEFLLEVGFNGDAHEVVGYAFRRRMSDGEMYQGVPVGYGEKNKLSVLIPPSEKGEEVFILARVAVEKGRPVPQDLKRALHVKSLEVKEKS